MTSVWPRSSSRLTATSLTRRISLIFSSALVLSSLDSHHFHVSCHLTPTGPSQQQNEVIANSAYKLQNLHLQHESGPEWLEIVRARGFIGELYTTLSRDNNPISIYHLINPLANQQTLNRYPVFIFHGVGMDATQMISHAELAKPRAPVLNELTSEPGDTSLAFMLSNNNFDVWMADARGTNLNNHLVSDDFNLLNANRYWNFSLDEQIHYDLTNIIDFVLEQTHEDKLHYVGYSQSTFMILALMASHIEYQDKLASVTLLAPVAYVEHVKGLAVTALASTTLLPEFVNGNLVPQALIDAPLTVVRQICQFQLLTHSLCPSLVTSQSGTGDNELSTSFYSAAAKPVSIKSGRHFVQLFTQRRYGMYDYGTEGNLRAYGTPTPPAYRLENIKIPSLSIFRGGHDFLSTHLDQQRLLKELGTKPYQDVYYPGYNHLDFLIGRNIVQEINLPTMKAMLFWAQELAKRDGSNSVLKQPAKAALPKPAKPVSVATPNGSRQIDIKTNAINHLINNLVQPLTHKIVDVDKGELLALPVLTQKDWKNPLSELASKLM